MSLPRRPRPPIQKISQTPPPTPSMDLGGNHSELDSRATMKLDGKEYSVSADDLELLGSLGRGQYGQVDKVRHGPSGSVIAVKRIRFTDDPEERKRMLMDMKVNSTHGGTCPYLVRSFGALYREGDLWICMEVMDISLEMFYKKVFLLQRTVPEAHIAYIACAVVSGLQFLKQEMNIMHRDVKPSNILLSRRGEVKLCDFGISGQLVQSMAKTRNVGCSLYMPPERVDPSAIEGPGFDVRSDVWSVGITLIEVAIGKHPYTAWKNPFEQMKQVVLGPPPKLPDSRPFSQEFRDFVSACCQKEPQQRPKYVDLLNYPFISMVQEGAKELLSAFVVEILDSPTAFLPV